MKKIIDMVVITIIAFPLFGCTTKAISPKAYDENRSVSPNMENQMEFGYGLTVDEAERAEAEKDCKKVMTQIYDIYQNVSRGESFSEVLNDETLIEMQKSVSELGVPVSTTITYSDMENYETVDQFLLDALSGKSGSVIIYGIDTDGAVERMKYLFDGRDMYLINVRGRWKEDGTIGISDVTYTRMKHWEYTEKGWFCYELCVPEPPVVSEVINGSYAVRIIPMTEENKEMSKKCVLGLGYQGNNVLCSDWDVDHMDQLDFNGVYEYLYWMKYQKTMDIADDWKCIPAEEFENLIMEYFPITKEQLREYAVYDGNTETYAWERLGCFNYSPTFFSTSLPEVTNVTHHADGTTTLTVDAVCDMVLCDDAVITHELKVKFEEDGSFQYLGNRILNDGIKNIPAYEYRIKS